MPVLPTQKPPATLRGSGLGSSSWGSGPCPAGPGTRGLRDLLEQRAGAGLLCWHLWGARGRPWTCWPACLPLPCASRVPATEGAVHTRSPLEAAFLSARSQGTGRSPETCLGFPFSKKKPRFYVCDSSLSCRETGVRPKPRGWACALSHWRLRVPGPSAGGLHVAWAPRRGRAALGRPKAHCGAEPRPGPSQSLSAASSAFTNARSEVTFSLTSPPPLGPTHLQGNVLYVHLSGPRPSTDTRPCCGS